MSWCDWVAARGSDSASSGRSRSEEEQEDLQEGIWEDIGEGSFGGDEEGLPEGGWACSEGGSDVLHGKGLYGGATDEGENVPESKGPLRDLTRSAAVSARGSRGGYYSCCPPAAGVGVTGDVVSSSISSSSFMLFWGKAQATLPVAVQPSGAGVKGHVANSSSSFQMFGGKDQSFLPIAVQPSGASSEPSSCITGRRKWVTIPVCGCHQGCVGFCSWSSGFRALLKRE